MESILPSIENIESFREFQESFNTSNKELGLENGTISDDNVLALAQEVWE